MRRSTKLEFWFLVGSIESAGWRFGLFGSFVISLAARAARVAPIFLKCSDSTSVEWRAPIGDEESTFHFELK